MMERNKRSLSPGVVIHNRYRIEQVLGEGGFGVTYMVTDTRENQIAAMKEYMPADIAYRRSGSVDVLPLPDCQELFERFRSRFLDEAKIIYRYQGHPNIIRVQHLFYENNTAYYVMEFINGMDLSKFLERNGQRLSWEVLRPIMSQVATALQAVHGSGIIHCDISPDNIFILKGGQVKLIDFGAAKSVLHGKSSIMLLKRGFAPPEQLSAQGRLGPWTDIYAVAVTIYRSFTGRMPPPAEDRLTSDRTLWPSQMGIAAPSPQWEQVLKKAMALHIEDRYQTVADFWNDLSGAQGGGQTLPRSVSPAGPYAVSRPPAQADSYAASHPAAQADSYAASHPAAHADSYAASHPAAQAGSHAASRVPAPFHPATDAAASALILEGIRGVWAGTRIPVQGEMLLGTDRSRCRIAFPPGFPGISRVHLRVWPDRNTLMVMDMGSSYGSWLGEQRMTPGLGYALRPGAAIYLGDGQVFRAAFPETG